MQKMIFRHCQKTLVPDLNLEIFRHNLLKRITKQLKGYCIHVKYQMDEVLLINKMVGREDTCLLSKMAHSKHANNFAQPIYVAVH